MTIEGEVRTVDGQVAVEGRFYLGLVRANEGMERIPKQSVVADEVVPSATAC